MPNGVATFESHPLPSDVAGPTDSNSSEKKNSHSFSVSNSKKDILRSSKPTTQNQTINSFESFQDVNQLVNRYKSYSLNYHNADGAIDSLPEMFLDFANEFILYNICFIQTDCLKNSIKNGAARPLGLRIMIITESFHPYTSGIARRFKEILKRLAQRGYFVHILTGCKGCESWNEDKEIKKRVTFSRLFAIEFKDKIDCALPFVTPQIEMIRALNNFKPDVIHCVEQTPATTFFSVLAKIFDIPIVWSTHTNLDFYIPLYIHPCISPISVRINKLLRRTFLNIADYNLTVSTDFASWLQENGGIKGPIYVWKTGVDSESFKPDARSDKMRLRMFNGHYAADKILLVSVGRLSPEKHFEFLLNILNRFPNVFLCIVGGGPYKESLEPLFPPDRTYFIGFLQGEDLAAAYASADYFVYASVSETFGQVYLEAMSSGIPIVAAEGQQMKEFFINGIHGYTWKPQNVDSACTALNNAIRNRSILSQNCRSNALNHSWESAAYQIADVYQSVVLKKQNTLRSQPFFLIRFLLCIFRSIYYLFIWLFLTFLVLSLVAPFMKVAKPSKNEFLNNVNGGSYDSTVYKNKNRRTQKSIRKSQSSRSS